MSAVITRELDARVREELILAAGQEAMRRYKNAKQVLEAVRGEVEGLEASYQDGPEVQPLLCARRVLALIATVIR
jgi:hypothetical protein